MPQRAPPIAGKAPHLLDVDPRRRVDGSAVGLRSDQVDLDVHLGKDVPLDHLTTAPARCARGRCGVEGRVIEIDDEPLMETLSLPR
jgi:hypothetical protein